MTLRVVVVDDERPAREKLCRFLKAATDTEVVAEAATGVDAVAAIRDWSPDLVFLDVQMPGLNGFEVVEAIGTDEMPAVVFVTAFDQYALAAFDVEAADYLLKPFDESRFGKALDRARRRLAHDAGTAGSAGHLDRVLTRLGAAQGYVQRLVATERDRVKLVAVREVYRFSAEGNYARVHTLAGNYLVRRSLVQLDERLDPGRFARIHRSDIVAIDAIKELAPLSHGDYDVVLKNGEHLRLSRRYQHRLLKSGDTA